MSHPMQQDLQGILRGKPWELTPATLAVKLSRGKWIAAPHLLYISSLIASRIASGGARLIVNMPPRHGKSELLSVWTPTWHMNKFPSRSIILTSYGADLATDFGRKVRDQIIEFGTTDELAVRLRADTKRVDRFSTTRNGTMYAIGVGGAITGRGAHLFLIDDYIKQAEDAASQTQRDKTFDWFESTAYTRLEPGASIVILATRWNIDDLSGRLNDMDDGRWEVITIPAIATDDDVLGRQPGEALWPERYPVEALMEIKSQLSDYFWQALYQQTPIPRGGGIAVGDFITLIDILPHAHSVKQCRHWDLAASTDLGSDWTVGSKVMWDPKQDISVIADIERKQLSPSGVEELIRQTALKDGPDVLISIEQEPGAAGKLIIDHYDRHILPEFTVKGVKPTGDKFLRAQPFYGAAENGRVRMRRGKWNQDLITELETFPDGAHDDQVDSVSGAYNVLTEARRRAGTWGRSTSTYRPTLVTPHQGLIVRGATWGNRK